MSPFFFKTGDDFHDFFWGYQTSPRFHTTSVGMLQAGNFVKFQKRVNFQSWPVKDFMTRNMISICLLKLGVARGSSIWMTTFLVGRHPCWETRPPEKRINAKFVEGMYLQQDCSKFLLCCSSGVSPWNFWVVLFVRGVTLLPIVFYTPHLQKLTEISHFVILPLFHQNNHCIFVAIASLRISEKTYEMSDCEGSFFWGKATWAPRLTRMIWRLQRDEFSPAYYVVVSNIFDFHPYLRKWSKLTNIFQIWNHHLAYNLGCFCSSMIGFFRIH